MSSYHEIPSTVIADVTADVHQIRHAHQLSIATLLLSASMPSITRGCPTGGADCGRIACTATDSTGVATPPTELLARRMEAISDALLPR